MPLSQQRDAAKDARRTLAREMVFLRARKVAMYMAGAGELDPQPIMEMALAMKKQCYLPIMSKGLLPHTGGKLVFQQYDPQTDSLAVNRYGIHEPLFDPRSLIPTRMLDLILTPLVAFDRQGNRLGMGKGYYDQTLAGLHRQWRRPTLLGMAHSFQEIDALAPEAWDIPLDGILTEKELFWIHTQH